MKCPTTLTQQWIEEKTGVLDSLRTCAYNQKGNQTRPFSAAYDT